MFSLHRIPTMMLCLLFSLFPPLLLANGAATPPVLTIAYNGSFNTIRVAKNSDTDVNDYKIKRGNDNGEKLLERSMSLLHKQLQKAKAAKDKQDVLNKANAEQKLVYVIYQFRKMMTQGGFQAYFRSDAGGRVAELKKALIAVHANQYLLVLNKATKAFADDPHVLDDKFGRNSVLDEMDEFERFRLFESVDAAYRSLEDDEVLIDRVAKYLNEHEKQFFAKAED